MSPNSAMEHGLSPKTLSWPSLSSLVPGNRPAPHGCHHVVLEDLIPCWPLLAIGRAVSPPVHALIASTLWSLAANPRKGLPRPHDQSAQGLSAALAVWSLVTHPCKCLHGLGTLVSRDQPIQWPPMATCLAFHVTEPLGPRVAIESFFYFRSPTGRLTCGEGSYHSSRSASR